MTIQQQKIDMYSIADRLRFNLGSRRWNLHLRQFYSTSNHRYMPIRRMCNLGEGDRNMTALAIYG